MKHTIEMKVNGETWAVEVDPGEVLLDVLREKIGVKSPKIGCERGDCGSCTVLYDGKTIRACLMLAVEADGHEITTLEGIGHDGLTTLQERWSRCLVPVRILCPGSGALGPRTAGTEPAPDGRAGQGGHLRQPVPLHRVRPDRRRSAGSGPHRARGCEVDHDADTYVGRADEANAKTRLKVVGKGTPRIDGLDKLTGAAEYVDDMDFGPGLLHAAVVESPHGYAQDPRDRLLQGRGAARRRQGGHRQGLPVHLRDVHEGPLRLRPGRGPLRRRAGGGGHRPGPPHRQEGGRAGRGGVRGARRRCSIR